MCSAMISYVLHVRRFVLCLHAQFARPSARGVLARVFANGTISHLVYSLWVYPLTPMVDIRGRNVKSQKVATASYGPHVVFYHVR